MDADRINFQNVHLLFQTIIQFKGNEIITSDERRLTVTAGNDGPGFAQRTAKRGQFSLNRMYPEESSTLILAPEAKVQFWCETTTPWLDCKWKNPKYSVPCSIFDYSVPQLCPWPSANGG